MERDDSTTEDVRDSKAVAAELAELEGEYESLRATTPLKRAAHVFLAMLLAVCGTSVTAPFLALTLDALGVARGPMAFIMLLSTIAMFVFYGWLFNKSLFVPKEGQSTAQQTLYWERRELRKELKTTLEREEDAAQALSNAQRANHGGNLSIAAPVEGGGLEVAVATEGSLTASDEVVLGLSDTTEDDEVDAVAHDVDARRDV